MAANMEEVFRIPVTSFKRKTAFGFDMGGSMVKVAYVQNADGDMADVHLASFPRDQLNEALDLIQEKCGHHIRQGDVLYTTGIGSHQLKKLIKERLQVSIGNISEFVCFVDAFKFLMINLPREEVIHETAPEVEEYRRVRLKGRQEGLESFNSHNPHGKKIEMNDDPIANGIEEAQTAPPAGKEGNQSDGGKDFLPCLLLMIGSGLAAIKAVDDAPYEFVDSSPRAGKMFLALGSMLTGCKSFDDIIHLAEKGRQDNVDTMIKHMKTGDSGDMYGNIPDDLIAYSFGQGSGRDLGDFRKEDIARSLLTTVAHDLAQVAYNNALVTGLSRVYICGSFPGLSHLVREEVGKAMVYRKTFSQHGKVDHAFLKYGGYLGAIGALFRNMGKDSSMSTL